MVTANANVAIRAAKGGDKVFTVKRVDNQGRVVRPGGHWREPDYEAAWNRVKELLEIWPAVQIWCGRRQLVEAFADHTWAACIGRIRSERLAPELARRGGRACNRLTACCGASPPAGPPPPWA